MQIFAFIIKLLRHRYIAPLDALLNLMMQEESTLGLGLKAKLPPNAKTGIALLFNDMVNQWRCVISTSL